MFDHFSWVSNSKFSKKFRQSIQIHEVSIDIHFRVNRIPGTMKKSSSFVKNAPQMQHSVGSFYYKRKSLMYFDTIFESSFEWAFLRILVKKSFSNFAFKPTKKRANFIRLFQQSFPIQKKLIRCLRKMQKFLILLVEDVKKVCWME